MHDTSMPPGPAPEIDHQRASRRWRIPLVWLGAIMIFTLGLTTGFVLDDLMPAASSVQAQAVSEVPSSFFEAWTLIHDRYVDVQAIDDQKLVGGAISGMLGTLGDDGHTRYLNPEQVQQHIEGLSGNFIGVGIQVEERDGRITVVAPLDNSPAQQAGIQSGDVLTQINGQEVTGLTIEAIVDQIRGPEGTTVSLTFERPSTGETQSYTLERVRLDVQSVSWSMLPDKVAVIRIRQFSSGTSDQLQSALQAIQQQGAEEIVLDLRNNPGGLVDEAIKVASPFLPEESPVFITQERDGHQTIYSSEPMEVRTSLPLAVLVNEGSASSAEIVAGALKENGRAVVIGQPTFGTGTLLNQFPLSDGSALLLGTELWLTPSGQMIRENGIQPDILVTMGADDAQFLPSGRQATRADIKKDAQLQRAILELTGATMVPPAGTEGCYGCI